MSVSVCEEGFEGDAVVYSRSGRHSKTRICTSSSSSYELYGTYLGTYMYVCDSVQMHVPDLIRQVVSSCKCRPAAL